MGSAADQYQYSAGLILYTLLAGDMPFSSSTSLGYLNKHMTAPPRPIRERRLEVPPALEAAVLKSLAKAPQDRFPSVAAFRAAIERALR